MLTLLAFNFFGAIAVGVYAERKGRYAGGAFLVSLLLSPILGFLMVAAMKDKVAERRHRELVDAIAAANAPKPTNPAPEYQLESISLTQSVADWFRGVR